MKILKGISLSDGQVLGKVCLFNEDILEAVREYDIPTDNIDKEKERFRQAALMTKQELLTSHDSVFKSLGNIAAEIFAAHILMLEDKSFSGKIEAIIEKDLVNAESAIIRTMKDFEGRFKISDNEYLRERAQDISEIARRLTKNLGVTHTGFVCTNCHDLPGVVAARELSATLVAGIIDKNVAAIITEKGSAHRMERYLRVHSGYLLFIILKLSSPMFRVEQRF